MRHYFTKSISIIIFSGFASLAFAAPIPLTGSSMLLNEKPGIYRSPLGFHIDAARTGWKQFQPNEENKFLATVYRSEEADNGVQAALTVRVDSIDKNEDLDVYTKKWMKDYPRLGFNILASKKVRVGNQVGFLIDLINRDNNIQLRQLLFVKNENVVNLTCRDHYKQFNDTLKSCNEIFRTFTW